MLYTITYYYTVSAEELQMTSLKSKIFKAADALDASGQKPTLAAVRKALGAGSFTTISEAMQEWKARKAAKENRPLAPPPASVEERLTDLGAEIWTLALEAANNQLTNDRQDFEETRRTLETERQEAFELVNQVTTELEALQANLEATEQSAKRAQDDALALREQTALLAQRAAAAEARVDEASRRADDLNVELARVNQQNAELIKALAQRPQP